MRKILDDGEKAFLKKLARLPDGIWRDRTYVECCRPGDRQVHRVMLTLKKEQKQAGVRERGHRSAGRRHQRHLLRLARRDHGGDQRADVLGAVLRGRRRAAPHRLQPDARHAELRRLPGLGVDRAGAVHGDLALPGLQRALEDDLPRPRAAQGRDVHRRHQPVAGDHLPRHRPVGRALRLHPGRPDRRRHRRLLARRRHLDRRPGAHADLQAAQRRAHRAELSGAVPVQEGNHRLGRRRQVPRRPVGRVLLHPARHRPASRTTRCPPATPSRPRPA